MGPTQGLLAPVDRASARSISSLLEARRWVSSVAPLDQVHEVLGTALAQDQGSESFQPRPGREALRPAGGTDTGRRKSHKVEGRRAVNHPTTPRLLVLGDSGHPKAGWGSPVAWRPGVRNSGFQDSYLCK